MPFDICCAGLHLSTPSSGNACICTRCHHPTLAGLWTTCLHLSTAGERVCSNHWQIPAWPLFPCCWEAVSARTATTPWAVNVMCDCTQAGSHAVSVVHGAPGEVMRSTPRRNIDGVHPSKSFFACLLIGERGLAARGMVWGAWRTGSLPMLHEVWGCTEAGGGGQWGQLGGSCPVLSMCFVGMECGRKSTSSINAGDTAVCIADKFHL